MAVVQQVLVSRRRSYRLAHLAVRVVVAVSVVDFTLAELYQPYFEATGHGLRGKVRIFGEIASMVMVPLYVVAEAWLMRHTPTETRAVMIDFAFAAVWLILFWGALMYSFSHAVPF
jgi:hypothetical protein